MPEKKILSPKQWRLLLSVWLLAQMAFLYYNGGVVQTSEAGSYIGVSNRMAEAGFSEITPRFYFYTVHILLLSSVRLLGLPYSCLYLLQLLISWLALVCYVRMLCNWCKRTSAVVVAAIAFGLAPFYQIWCSYLYTDANFANLLLIAIYLLTQTKSPNRQKWFFVVLLLLTFYRPLGVLVVPVSIAFWIGHKSYLWKAKAVVAAMYAAGILLLIWFCLQQAKGYFYPGHNAEANIICGYSSSLTRYIQHPYNPDKSMLHFLLSNPGMTWRLLLGRLLKAFWLTRPYYSGLHNSLFTLLLVPFYILVVWGMVVLIHRTGLGYNAFLFCGLAVFTLPLLLFCVDWSNRFILPAMVFLFIFMGIGIDALAGVVRILSGQKKAGNR